MRSYANTEMSFNQRVFFLATREVVNLPMNSEEPTVSSLLDVRYSLYNKFSRNSDEQMVSPFLDFQ